MICVEVNASKRIIACVLRLDSMRGKCLDLIRISLSAGMICVEVNALK